MGCNVIHAVLCLPKHPRQPCSTQQPTEILDVASKVERAMKGLNLFAFKKDLQNSRNNRVFQSPYTVHLSKLLLVADVVLTLLTYSVAADNKLHIR